MRKFFILLKKELRELITPVMVIPILIMIPIFALAGSAIQSSQDKGQNAFSLGLLDEDRGRISKGITSAMKKTFKVIEFQDQKADEALEKSQAQDLTALIVIPKNFGDDFEKLEKPKIQISTIFKNFSILSYEKTAKIQFLKQWLTEILSNQIITAKSSYKNPSNLKNPIDFKDVLILNNKKAEIGINEVNGFIQSQTAFIPVILMVVIIFAAQMVAVTIASEKENKTLEILLSSPLNRKAIVLAKILAATIVALLFCTFYAIGFHFFLGSITQTAIGTETATLTALEELGLIFTSTDYILIAISLFMATLCGLAIAIILGILAENVQAIQMVTTPLVLLILIPYLIILFFDVDTLPEIIRYIIYAIPFSHPFLAIQKTIIDQQLFIIYGILYEAFVAIVVVILAAKIFSSDKILTIKLNFLKKQSKPEGH